MLLEMSCPHCAAKYRLADDFAGKKIRCKRCQQAFPVAGKSERKAQPAREPAPAAQNHPYPASSPTDCGPTLVPLRKAKDRADTSGSVWGTRRGLVLGLGSAAGLLVVAGLIWLIIFLIPNAVDQQLKDLKTGAPEMRRQALVGLLEADPQDADRARVTAALEPFLFDDLDPALNPDLLLRAYLHWANKDNVPAMIRMVANPTLPAWDSRKAGLVLETLGKFKDERAIAVLAELLPDPVLHDRAINALKVMGPRAEPAVLEYLFDKDPDTRARANQLLADYGTKPETIVAEALNYLKSSPADLRLGAASWFAENLPSDETSKTDVAKILVKLLDDASPKIASQALRALKSWATKDCLPQLRDYARRQQKAAFVNPELIDVLAQFPDETAAEAIALLLPNPALRARASAALLKLDTMATRAIVPYLDYPDDGVQKEARDLCRLLKIPVQRQLDYLLADIAGSDIPRSRAALQNLAQLRPDEASRTRVARALNTALLDTNNGIREDALNAVKVWGSWENTAALLQLLGDIPQGDRDCNTRVIEILGSLKDPRAAQQLAQGLTHVRERGAVSLALKAMGPAAEEAVIPFLQSPDPEARFTACRILGDIGTDKSLPALQTAAQIFYLDPAFNQEVPIATQQILARCGVPMTMK